MAASAGTRPPPAHLGPNVGNLFPYPNSGVPNPGPQEPGLQGSSQDPGPPSHYHPHYLSARPIFCVPAPPPPPFLQYQWPMPFSYNPFAGFPGMGYGMVMPQFPMPPYMEPPTYIVPAPHLQPMDYRRMPHPQVHASSAPYQNPNHTRRVRTPHTLPMRESVSSGVQTDTPGREERGHVDGSLHVRSDSGHGTASSSPSSSSSSIQKQGSAVVENLTLTNSNPKDLQVPGRDGFIFSRATETKTVEHADQGNVPPYRTGHCNMWSVSSSESVHPVCSSSQHDEVVKERRVSIPDILSWAGGTSQANMQKMTGTGGLHQNNHEVQPEKSVYPIDNDGSLELGADLATTPRENQTFYKILKFPFELLSNSGRENEAERLAGCLRTALPNRDEPTHSIKKFCRNADEQEHYPEMNPQDVTADIIPYDMSLNSSLKKRKMNESVWSVESLAPFIPAEWRLSRGPSETPVFTGKREDAESGALLAERENLMDNCSKDRRRSRRFPSDLESSWLLFSSPADLTKPPPTESETSESRQCQGVEESPLDRPTRLPCEIIVSTPTKEDVEENRSSEPEANQSPNQDCLAANVSEEKCPSSSEQEETGFLNCGAEGKTSATGQLGLQSGVDKEVSTSDASSGSEDVGQPGIERLLVPECEQTTVKVSPSRATLVDCGIQCNEMLCLRCGRETLKRNLVPSRGNPLKSSDNGGKAEGHMHKNQKRFAQRRNRGQEYQTNQQEGCHGNYGKPGKSKGGNGKNSLH